MHFNSEDGGRFAWTPPKSIRMAFNGYDPELQAELRALLARHGNLFVKFPGVAVLAGPDARVILASMSEALLEAMADDEPFLHDRATEANE